MCMYCFVPVCRIHVSESTARGTEDPRGVLVKAAQLGRVLSDGGAAPRFLVVHKTPCLEMRYFSSRGGKTRAVSLRIENRLQYYCNSTCSSSFSSVETVLVDTWAFHEIL